MKRDEQLRQEFNDWASAGRGEGMEKGHRPVGEQAIELMNIPSGASVLDLGCGNGWATRLLAEKARDGRVVGIDIADEMIRIAEKGATALANVEFRVASACGGAPGSASTHNPMEYRTLNCRGRTRWNT